MMMNERLTDEEIDAIAAPVVRSELLATEWRGFARAIEAAAPLARQEPRPDAVYPVQPSSEAATARALANGFDGSQVRPGPNHSTIEIWYDTEAQARAAHKAIRDQIEASLSSTPAQGDGGTSDLSAVDRITDANRHGEAWPDAAKHIYQGGCPDETQPGAFDPECPACSARGNVQRHITDMLVAHRDMIDAQQRGDSAAEVLAVQRMEAARSAVAGQTPRGVEQTEPFWCHEQSHDRPRCDAQCAECAEDGVPESQESNVVETLRLARLALRNATAPVGNHSARTLIGGALLALDRAIAVVALPREGQPQ